MSADPHRALRRALKMLYPELAIVEARSEPWASATFIGARHDFLCSGPAPTGIDHAEFDLCDHIVADIAWRPREGLVRIEALTIEAA